MSGELAIVVAVILMAVLVMMLINWSYFQSFISEPKLPSDPAIQMLLLFLIMAIVLAVYVLYKAGESPISRGV
jgi:uncharacterized membrane protein YwzB